MLWLALSLLVPAQVTADLQTAALIQQHGRPLSGGMVTGGSESSLERAERGDTPILTFSSARGPVRLLLDTGASSALVSPALVRRLGLSSRPLSPEAFSLAGGGADCQSLQLSSTRLPELHMPSASAHDSLRLQGLEAVVIPVDALPKGVDGVLGVPSLQHLPFVVDPLKGTVLFGRAAQQWRQAVGPPTQVIPLFWRHGVPLMQIRVPSRSEPPHRLHEALLDSGAEGLFLTERLAAMLTPLTPGQSALLVGVCGQQVVLRQRLLGIGFETTLPLQSVEALVTHGPVFSFLGVEAIVGQEWLRTRRQLWRLDASPPRLELW